MAAREPEPPKPIRERTRRETRRTSPPAAVPPAAAVRPPEPEPEEELTGDGALRIRATTGGKVEVKVPGREREALPLSVQRMAAGKHPVDFFMDGGGRARCTVKVRPERRTLVTFDGKSCSVEHL